MSFCSTNRPQEPLNVTKRFNIWSLVTLPAPDIELRKAVSPSPAIKMIGSRAFFPKMFVMKFVAWNRTYVLMCTVCQSNRDGDRDGDGDGDGDGDRREIVSRKGKGE